MNSQDIKKWGVLLSLLLITLVLVWNAPKPVPEQNVVQAKKEQRVVTNSAETEPEQEKNLLLKQRQLATSDIDLFDTVKRNKPVVKPVIPQPTRLEKKEKIETKVTIPFKYIGMMQKNQKTTLFLLSGPALYLVQQGDVVKADYKLQFIDIENKQLEWLYLPLKETHKMSMEK